MSKFYLTTAIPYASSKPHIGNTYEAILTDCVARYRRLRGDDVFFLTGMDEHGQKIEKKAAERGIVPQEVANEITEQLREQWRICGVEYSDFIRTTEPRHMDIVTRAFRRLYEQGDIYKGSYEGWYCVEDEAFYTETQAGPEHKCPDCGREVQKASEEAYFFRLSAYGDRLMKHVEENPEFIMPESRRNEMVNNFLKPGLQDFCVSRTSFKWGIPVDFDPGHVIYVWVDALMNYITALGYSTENDALFKKYWPCDVHFIGKDILRFHTLYWPAILMALDVPLPKRVFAHPWYLMGNDKMSKSLGNVIYADELCRDYGQDAVRYYCLREMAYAQDSSITRELFLTRYNADLANDLGNLASRTVAMVEKYFGGVIPTVNPIPHNELDGLYSEVLPAYEKHMEVFQIQQAVTETMRLVARANRYIDQTMPWILAKDEAKHAELALVLRALCESLRRVSVLLYPVMPQAMKALRLQLGLEEIPEWNENPSDSYSVKRGEVLFPRKELAVVPEQADNAAPVQEEAHKTPEITIDDFMGVELCVAKVLSCEPVPKADKLLHLTVDTGDSSPRDVLSGIAEWYKPEDLSGKSVILVKNLAPRKMRGFVSHGMILAADDGEKAKVIFAPDGLTPGSRVR